MMFPGQSEDGNRMEVMELGSHPYFVGVQYHPEYLSRPIKPSAPYLGFVLAASGKLKAYLDSMHYVNGGQVNAGGQHQKIRRKNSHTGKNYFYLNTFDESTAQLSQLNEKSASD